MRIGVAYVDVQVNMDKYKASLADLTRKADAASQKVRNSFRKMEKAGTQLGSSSSKTAGHMDKISRSADRQKKSFAGLLPHVATVTASYMAMRSAWRGVIAGVTVGVEFEKKMSVVQAVSRTTEEDFKNLEKAAREMAVQTVFTSVEAADALKYLAMAGIDAKESIKALPGVLNLALIGELELGRATDIATDTLSAFGLGAKDLDRVVDVMVSTITRSNTNIEMMGQAMKFAAPVAKSLGYEVEQVSAMIGTLAKSGVKAGIAGRNLQQAFIRTQKAAKNLGVEFDSNLIEVLERYNEIEKRLTEEYDRRYARLAVASKATKDYGLVALKSILILKDNIKAYKELYDAAKNSAGETDRAAAIMQDNVDSAWKLVKSAISDLSTEIFSKYKDSIKGFLFDTSELIRSSSQSISEHVYNVIGGLSGITEGLSTILSPLAGVAKSIGELIEWYLKLPQAVVGASGAGIIVGILGRSTQLGLIAAALVVVNDQIRDLNIGLDLTKSVGDNFKGVLETAKSDLNHLIDVIDKSARKAGKDDAGLFNKLAAAVMNLSKPFQFAYDDVEQFLQGAGLIPDSLQKIDKSVYKVGTTIIDGEEVVRQYNIELSKLCDTIAREKLENLPPDAKDVFEKALAFEKYKTSIEEMFAGIKEAAAGEISGEMSAAIDATIRYLIKKYKEGADAAKKAAKKAFDDTVKAAIKMDDEIIDAHEAMNEYELDLIRKSIKEKKKRHEHFLNEVHDITADVFYKIFDGQIDSFGNFCDEMFDMFKKVLAEMAAAAAAETIVIPVVTNVANSIGLGSLIGTTGSSSLGLSGIPGLGNLASLFPGVSNFLGSAVLPAWGYGAGGVMVSGSATASAGLSASGSAGIGAGLGGMTWGQLLGGIGALTGAVVALTSIFDEPHHPHLHTAFSLGYGDGSFGYESMAGNNPEYYSVGVASGRLRGPGDINEAVDKFNDLMVDAIESYLGEINSIIESSGVTDLSVLEGLEFEFTAGYHGDDIEDFIQRVLTGLAEEFEAHAGQVVGALAPQMFANIDFSSVSGLLSSDSEMFGLYGRLEELSGMGTLDADQLQEFLVGISNITDAIEIVGSTWDDISYQMKVDAGEISELDQQIHDINVKYDDWYNTLEALGFSEEYLNQVRTYQTQAINDLTDATEESTRAAQAAAAVELADTWDDISYQMQVAAGEVSELDQQINSLNSQYDTWYNTLEELGASEAQLAEVRGYQTQAINDLVEATEESTRAAQAAAEEEARRAQRQYEIDVAEQIQEENERIIEWFQNRENTWQDILSEMEDDVSDMTDYERALESLNQRYDEYYQTLWALNIGEEKLNQVREYQLRAIEALEQAEEERLRLEEEKLRLEQEELARDLANTWQDINYQMRVAAGEFSEFEQQLHDISTQYDEYYDTLKDLGASEDQLNQVREYQIRAIEDLTQTTLEQVRVTREANLELARTNYMDALSREISEYQAAYAQIEDAMAQAQAQYISGLQREIAAKQEVISSIQDTIDAYEDAIKSISDYKAELVSDSSVLTVDARYRRAQAALEETVSDLYSGDEATVRQALEDIPGMSQDFLDASLDYNADFSKYRTDFARVQSILNTSESIAEHNKAVAERQLTIEERSLSKLESTLNSVQGIDDNLLSLIELQQEYYAAKMELDESVYPALIEADQAELEALQSIDENILTVAEALQAYLDAQEESRPMHGCLYRWGIRSIQNLQLAGLFQARLQDYTYCP